MEYRTRSTPIWPFLLLLAFLFALSLTAPRHWEKYAQRTALEKPMRMLARTGSPYAGLAQSKFPAAAPRPAQVAAAETLPRVTSQYAAPAQTMSPASYPVLTQPNLSVPAKPAESTSAVASATIPGIPVLSGGSGGPTLSPLPSQPTLDRQPKAEERPQLPAPSQSAPQSQHSAESDTAAVPEYRPSPSGFLLHAGHQSPPAATATATKSAPPSAPTMIVTAKPAAPQVATLPTLPTMVAVPTPTAAPTPTPAHSKSIAAVPVKPVVPQLSAPKLTAPQLTAPQLTAPQLTAPATASKPAQQPVATPLVARRDDPKFLRNPAGGLSSPQKIATPEPKKSTVTAKAAPSWWPAPVDLYGRLAALDQHPETRGWSQRTQQLLDNLTHTPDVAAANKAGILKQLRAALADTRLLEEQKLDPHTALEVRLTRHALQRRLDVWESLAGLPKPEAAASAQAQRKTDHLAVCLVELERETAAAGGVGQQWRDYLMLDSLGDLARRDGAPSDGRALAKTVLDRLRRASESSDDNAFLRQGAFADLDSQLRALADVDVDSQALLASIEQFEAGQLPSDAHALAEQCKMLDYSTDLQKRQLAVWLTSHYRNANLRVTLSSDLVNRMLPEPLRRSAPVNDTVLGMPTHGWSTTRTGISIHFLPSNDSLAMRMLADGVVHAQTQTFSGPVRLFNHSDSNFKAHKDFSLTPRGVEVLPASASTLSRSRLQGIRTEFEHMPIVSSIVESIALDKAAEKRFAAQREAADKVSRQVEAGLDKELNKHLQAANEHLDQKIAAPLAKLGLSPEVIELQSNEARAIMRLRVAGEEQLASHTPRPRAYSDNVASLQIHQSAVNNILERIGFQGRRFTAAELYRFAVDELYVPDTVDPALIPDDIEIAFADKDPITIRCEEGRVELRLAIQELKRAGKSWRNFVVRAEFKTAVLDEGTCFVRDGTIHLSGDKLPTTSQIALRTVFAKVFPDDVRLPLWPENLRADARFADLDVQQVDIRDGWLGMAIGPRRVQTAQGLRPPRR